MSVSVEHSSARRSHLHLPELCCQAPDTPEDETAQKRSSFSQGFSKKFFIRAGTKALCVTMVLSYISLKPDWDSQRPTCLLSSSPAPRDDTGICGTQRSRTACPGDLLWTARKYSWEIGCEFNYLTLSYNCSYFSPPPHISFKKNHSID